MGAQAASPEALKDYVILDFGAFDEWYKRTSEKSGIRATRFNGSRLCIARARYESN